jgi:hypothetical protein
MPWSECDKWAGNACAWLPKKSSPALDAPQKPYYCGSKNPHVSAVFTTALLGLAPARSTRASAANHRKSISARPHDDSVIANGNVISKRRITPVRSIPAPRGGTRGEQKSMCKQFRDWSRRSDRPFRGFLPRKTTPRDLYRTTVIAKVL